MNRTLFFPVLSITALALGVLGILAILSFTDEASAQPPLACPANLRPDGLVSYWKLDEASGSSFADAVADNDATCSGDSCPSPESNGKVSGAQTFDGTNDAINIPDSDAFDWGAGDSFTFELWMQGNSQTCFGTGNNNNEVFIGRADGNQQLWIGCLASTKRVAFKVQDDEFVGALSDTSGPQINDGEWHHIVGVRDGAGGVNRIYVDGVERNSAAETYTAGFATDNGIILGGLNLSGSTDFYLNGILDEVAIYNRALSEDEIQRNYEYGKNADLGYCVGDPGIILDTALNPPAIRAGETISFTYSVGLPDTSIIPLSNVTVSDTTCDGPLDTPSSGDENENSNLDPGEDWEFICSASVDADTNDTAKASGQDPAEDDIESAATNTLVDVINPSITVSQTASQPIIRQGSNITFTYTVANTGDDELTNVAVTDAACGPITTTETGPLAPAAERTFTCSTALSENTTSEPTVVGTDSAGGTVDNTAEAVTVEVINPSLTLTLSVDQAEIDPGETVTFTYLVANTGDVEIENVAVQGDDTCSPITSTENGPLAAGEDRTFTCAVALNNDVETTATATGTDSTGAAVESAEESVTVDVRGVTGSPDEQLFIPLIYR